jgi:hypothetical protein
MHPPWRRPEPYRIFPVPVIAKALPRPRGKPYEDFTVCADYKPFAVMDIAGGNSVRQ